MSTYFEVDTWTLPIMQSVSVDGGVGAIVQLSEQKRLRRASTLAYRSHQWRLPEG